MNRKQINLLAILLWVCALPVGVLAGQIVMTFMGHLKGRFGDDGDAGLLTFGIVSIVMIFLGFIIKAGSNDEIK